MELDWSSLKALVDAKSISIQYVTVGSNYWLKAIDGPFVVDCLIPTDPTHPDTDDFLTNYHANGNKKLGPMSSDNVPIVEVGLRRSFPGADALTIVSHDFTDRTTWFQKSVKLTDQSLTDSGDGLTFQAPVNKRHWIDIDSPNLTYDHNKLLMRDGSFGEEAEYRVIVKVNSVVQTTGYTVNFTSGSVTFSSSQTGNTVVATYYHNDGITDRSEFLLNPPATRVFRLEHVEMQFSKNLTLPKPVKFQVWAGGTLEDYSDFNDTLYSAGYGQSQTLYRNHRDFINWCNNQYPVIPAAGDLTEDILVYPFKFIVATDIDPSLGILMRTVLVDDEPLVGELGTVTFYTESRPA